MPSGLAGLDFGMPGTSGLQGLSKEAREFLGKLNPKEFGDLEQIVKVWGKAKFLGALGKWIFISILALLLTWQQVENTLKNLGRALGVH